jgi:hypothetical protein
MAGDLQKLSGAQIRVRFSGMQFTDEVHWRYVYDRGGRLRSYSMGTKKVGTWTVEKDELCLYLKEPDDGCYKVSRSGERVALKPSGAGLTLEGVLQTPADRHWVEMRMTALDTERATTKFSNPVIRWIDRRLQAGWFCHNLASESGERGMPIPVPGLHAKGWRRSSLQCPRGANSFDAAAVASCPCLRTGSGAGTVVSIDDILEALSSLDRRPRHPPGGKTQRLTSIARAAVA